MEQKIINPNDHSADKAARYNLGDIVVLKSFATHCSKVGNEFHFKATAPINISPFMVIVRADRNEKNYRTDDKQSQDFVRYRCMWYDPNKGDFQEEVFFESLLFRVRTYDKVHVPKKDDEITEEEKLLFGKTALFRTREFEMSKVFPEHNPYNRFREIVNFIPPDLTVAGFKQAYDLREDGTKKQPFVYLNRNKEVIRYDYEHRVVCQWYSTAQGKFLKKDFIPHVLEYMPMSPNFVEG